MCAFLHDSTVLRKTFVRIRDQFCVSAPHSSGGLEINISSVMVTFAKCNAETLQPGGDG